MTTTTYDWSDPSNPSVKPQNRPRTADRAASVGSKIITAAAGQPAFDYEAQNRNSTPGVNAAYDQANLYNQPVVAQPVDPFAAYGGVQGLINSISGGSGGGSTADSALARDKWMAEQATAKAALAGLQNRLATGGYRGNADTLLGLIGQQNTQGQQAIQGNYNTGIGNINAGYDTAQGMVDTGYGQLNQYLGANQINPYAGMQQQVSPVNNAMANYLSAYGVSNDPVNQQVQASQIANQQGADSFNQLQQMMSANQEAGNQSARDVAQMAKNYATTNLGSQRAGYMANADSARTNALNTLLDQINAATYGVEEGVGKSKNDLENAIITAGGNVSEGKTESKTPATRSDKVAEAPSKYPNFKAALADMNPKYKFTTMAAAKKDFKNLAAAFKK